MPQLEIIFPPLPWATINRKGPEIILALLDVDICHLDELANHDPFEPDSSVSKILQAAQKARDFWESDDIITIQYLLFYLLQRIFIASEQYPYFSDSTVITEMVWLAIAIFLSKYTETQKNDTLESHQDTYYEDPIYFVYQPTVIAMIQKTIENIVLYMREIATQDKNNQAKENVQKHHKALSHSLVILRSKRVRNFNDVVRDIAPLEIFDGETQVDLPTLEQVLNFMSAFQAVDHQFDTDNNTSPPQFVANSIQRQAITTAIQLANRGDYFPALHFLLDYVYLTAHPNDTTDEKRTAQLILVGTQCASTIALSISNVYQLRKSITKYLETRGYSLSLKSYTTKEQLMTATFMLLTM